VRRGLATSAVWGPASALENDPNFCLDRFPLLQLRVFGFGFFQDGDVGVGVFPEGKKSSDGFRYCGSPTFRTKSANRGSERMGSSKKSVFKLSKEESRS
jgi:hypothetical protein